MGGDQVEPKKRKLRKLPAVIPVRALAPTILTVLALMATPGPTIYKTHL